MKKYILILVVAIICLLGAVFCFTDSSGNIKINADGVNIEIEEERSQLDRLIDRTEDLIDRTNK